MSRRIVSFAYILQIGKYAGILAHQAVKHFRLSGRKIVFSKLLARHIDSNAWLRLMLFFEMNIARLRQKMQGRVGLQYGQSHHLIDCGGCGAPSCNAFAEDVVQEKAQLNQCVFRRGNNDG